MALQNYNPYEQSHSDIIKRRTLYNKNTFLDNKHNLKSLKRALYHNNTLLKSTHSI